MAGDIVGESMVVAVEVEEVAGGCYKVIVVG